MSDLLTYFKGDELAADVWLNKYAMEGEKTPDDMHRRMAKRFAEIENHYSKNNDSETSAYYMSRIPLTEERIYELFKDFKYIVPQGSVMSMLGNGKIGSLSNCFVIPSPIDSYGGIFTSDEQLAQLMKRRGGVGVDISTLRPGGAEVSNAAKTSSGAVSFMHRFSNTTREVAQNGRRGALMLTIDVRHPDIFEFVKIKQDLTKVTGANISVRVTDDFITAVKQNELFTLRWPVNQHVTHCKELNKLEAETRHGITIYKKTILARDLWNEITKSAHATAEPGVLFWDNILNYGLDAVYDEYRPVSTNPCGEITLQPYDACRLIALNLYSFVDNPFTPEAEVDFNKLYEVAYEQQRLADDLVDLELEHIERILYKIKDDPEPPEVKMKELDLWYKIYNTCMSSRRTGSGFTGLGDMLAALGLKYDSKQALELIDKVMYTKMSAEFDCTVDLAIERGSFDGWCAEKENNKAYFRLQKLFPTTYARMVNHGRRNVSWSTVAPTGTVSIMTQTTSGIEPLYQPFYMRRKKVNPGEVTKIDFVDKNGDHWVEYPVIHPKFYEWMKVHYKQRNIENFTKEDLETAFSFTPWYQATAADIDWVYRIRMQAVVQTYTTHSISSTLNLPAETTTEQVNQIYEQAYDSGLKGVTIYRDGCRDGVLITNKKSEFAPTQAPKRPKTLPCHVHYATVKGEKFIVAVGLFEEKPYEVFAFSPNGVNPPNNSEAFITKAGRGKYVLHSGKSETDKDYFSYGQMELKMSDEEAILTRLISTSLRHGAETKFVVEQLNKSDFITSFSKSIARTLKKFIPDNTKVSGHKCEICGSENLVYEQGCHTCQSCGNSKCS